MAGDTLRDGVLVEVPVVTLDPEPLSMTVEVRLAPDRATPHLVALIPMLTIGGDLGPVRERPTGVVRATAKAMKVKAEEKRVPQLPTLSYDLGSCGHHKLTLGSTTDQVAKVIETNGMHVNWPVRLIAQSDTPILTANATSVEADLGYVDHVSDTSPA